MNFYALALVIIIFVAVFLFGYYLFRKYFGYYEEESSNENLS
jgi:Kef-type K+ transport system membrane component KefB